MHRDKGGAAAVAGFMHAVNVLKPSNIKIIAGLAMVRNSVGSEAYLADEIITARSGKRVRVGNTDAEGRMAMVDLLCHAKERCIKENLPDPEIYTIATLTGHACIAFGTYSGIVANGPYRKAKLDLNWPKWENSLVINLMYQPSDEKIMNSTWERMNNPIFFSVTMPRHLELQEVIKHQLLL